MNLIYNELCEKIGKERVYRNEQMKNHTSFKIGGTADIFIKVDSIEHLIDVLKIAKERNIPFYLIGNGSNLLVKDRGIRGIVLQLDWKEYFIQKEQEKYIVTAQAGVKLAMLAQKVLQQELTGLEFASGIPGTIGGAIRMNAGAYGSEFKDIVITTKYLDSNTYEIKELTNSEQEFSYRNSIFCKQKNYIILETKLELEQGKKEEIESKMQEYARQRKEKQPLEFPSAGSTFKRTDGQITAKLIDECGLKGYCIGDAQVSKKHAGFVINKGNATAQEVLTLVEEIKKRVYNQFKVKIELEIEVIGE